MEGLRYLALSLALGLVATWASENLFWFIPPPDISLSGWLLTWMAYSTCTACALSFVLWSGAGGWPAAFLGGAVLGYLLEGIVVGTIYDAFPVQLVWTPLAWHALITGGVIIGLGLAPLRLIHRAALWLGVGVCASVWGLYWPTERGTPQGSGPLLVYLALPGLAAALALWAAGHIPRPSPRPWVLWIAPAIAMSAAVFQAASFPSVLRLALPAMLGLLWLALRRSGYGRWGEPAPLSHHLTLLVAPVFAAFAAPALWATVGPAMVAVPFAFATSLLALGILLWIVLRKPRTRGA